MNTYNKNKTRLELKNITAGYDDNIVVSDINLNLHEGEIVSIIGLSGVGKSTIFNVIAGLLKPFQGSVILNNKDITNQSGYVSYMLQKDLLLPFKTVEENIALPLIIRGMKKKEAIAEASKHLADFGLGNNAKSYPKELSGGMRQRAALLRTYMFSKEIALLDEPFSALDSITRNNMQLWYLNIMKNINLSTIFITHDIDEAIKLSHNVYILKDKPAKLCGPYEINLNDRFDILSDEFINLKKSLIIELNI